MLTEKNHNGVYVESGILILEKKARKARTTFSKAGHKPEALGKIVETCSAYIFSAP